MIYSIPKRLKEEVKVWDKPITIFFKDVAVAGIIVFFFWFMSGFVNAYLLIPFLIFATISTIYLILPAGKINHGKRKWQAIYFVILNDTGVYRSIDYVKENSNENKEEK